MGSHAPRHLGCVMAAETPAPAFDLKLHIRRIRAELEARGIWIDDELDDALMEMMRLGREASEAGRTPLTDGGDKEGAVRPPPPGEGRGGRAYIPPHAKHPVP